MDSSTTLRRLAAYTGLAAVGLFAIALVVFSGLDADFHTFDDYVSKLGARGKPYGLWWNLIGFLLVGLLLAVFGYAYGRILNDKLVGTLLVVFGLGFALTAIPIDETDGVSGLSTAHILAICLGLAAWMFALARLAHVSTTSPKARRAANFAAGLFFIPLIGQALELWLMPHTHRLVFVIVFGWLVWTAVQLLTEQDAQAA
ncbi:MAG: DUF998 domain-containing protein [Pseudomonadota bacterium]